MGGIPLPSMRKTSSMSSLPSASSTLKCTAPTSSRTVPTSLQAASSMRMHMPVWAGFVSVLFVISISSWPEVSGSTSLVTLREAFG